MAGDPSTSRIVEVRLGARSDRRDFDPARCLAKRKGVGDQCGRFPASGRVVCIVHGAGSKHRQQQGLMTPEVSGAIGSFIRDMRRGQGTLDAVTKLFPDLQERLDAYRQDPKSLDLREDAVRLTALRDLLLSRRTPLTIGDLCKQLSRLAVAKAKVLATRDAFERRHAVPIEHHHAVTEQLVGIIRRYVAPELHPEVARELRLISASSRTPPTTSANVRRPTPTQ